MKKLNSKGFGAVEAILVAVIVGIIAGASYMVYNSQKKTNKSLDNANSSLQNANQAASKKVEDKKKAELDPTKDWKAYTDEAGKFSLKYPATWVKATNPELCSPGILLLGPTKESVGKCASEGFGEVSIVSSDSDTSSSYSLSTGYADTNKEDVTVNDVKGVKLSGVAKGQANTDGPAIGALADGTIVVKYIFVTNNKTYVASYTQKPDYPDVLSDFNILVTKTLTFNK